MANPSLVTPLSDQKIFEMQRTMGLLAGESWVVIKRRAGLEPPLSSFSYLLGQNVCQDQVPLYRIGIECRGRMNRYLS